MYTTLKRIREHRPCKDGWEKLLKHLGKTTPDDEPLSLLTILDSNGFSHALWCFRAVEGFEKEKLLLGIGFAREVEHLMLAESKKALDVFERYVNRLATEDEFETARRAAADVSYAVYDAAYDVAHLAAAYEAARAVYDAASYAAAHAAAVYAAHAAAYAAARAVCDAAYDARADAAARTVYDAAHSTVKAKQETQLRQLLDKTCTQP